MPPGEPTAIAGSGSRSGSSRSTATSIPAGLGTYTSSHNPLAVYSPAADRTFFTYGGTIKGQRHLLIMASYFDHKTGRVPRPTIVHDKRGVDDPHDNGSINLDDRGYVWIFISGRARKRPRVHLPQQGAVRRRGLRTRLRSAR
jgi:hypothetical protein